MKLVDESSVKGTRKAAKRVMEPLQSIAYRQRTHSPALIAPPASLDALIRLVNLLPKQLRTQPNRRDASQHLDFGKDHIIEFWSLSNDEDTVGRTWYFFVLTDALPLELQAFILHDDEGRYVPTSFSPAPLLDPEHLQPYTNIRLLGSPQQELQRVVTTAKERIRIEEAAAESASTADYVCYDRRNYEIGDDKFRSSGLFNLINRARQRLLFVMAAEEILDALSGPDSQEKLNRARYVDSSGATRGYLYVKNGQVQIGPPVLFHFVVGIDATPVRKCKVCENYFWAGRIDKKVCSTRCSASNRKKNERDRYREVGKYQRYLRSTGQTLKTGPPAPINLK